VDAVIRQHPLLTTATALYLAVVGWVTLGPQPTGLVRAAGVWQLLGFVREHPSLSWITYSRIEFSANVVMFLPVGVLLLLLMGRRGWWAAILTGFVLSVAIEAAQLLLPGRVSDIRDLVANSLGTALGVLLALVITLPAVLRRRRVSRPRTGEIRLA
jgi:glycopeptide antibiotics resistance protein